MNQPRLNRADYERWAHDQLPLKAPFPSEKEITEAHRVNVLDAVPTNEGCALRLIAMSGGSIDFYLNAAQAIHLFRNLALAGIDGGWMDEKGQPTTTPPTEDDQQRYPAPRHAKAYLDRREQT